MNVGFVGLGKLGLPTALAIESMGHTVVGCDIDPNVGKYVREKTIPYIEAGVSELLSKTNLELLPLGEVLRRSEIIFVPVQTPHDPLYEGSTRLPKTTADFDYSYLKSACRDISEELDRMGEDRTIVIISTVLPGTIQREIRPMLSKYANLCYNPFFIAMGTAMHDFLNPEIVLLGVDDPKAAAKVREFYSTITDAPVHEMTITNAELVKVNYNTFITMKINFANNLMEVCHKMRDMGADVDVVINALSDCNKRIISSTYMGGGMPDGGGCHPRDNIALADFARRHKLSNDVYTDGMMVRERHISWLAGLIKKYDMPKVILGKSYKPATNLTVGSPAIRLYNELKDKVKVSIWDPHVDGGDMRDMFNEPSVFFIGTKHDYFRDAPYPDGSVILDPFGYVLEKEKITIVRIGRQ